jgi:hypothetical protein
MAVLRQRIEALQVMPQRMQRLRRVLQYSLRTFLLLLTACCIALGVKSQSVRKQREVVGLVERLGGTLAYDHQYSEDPFSVTAPKPPPGPALLRKLVGDDFFATLVKVEVGQAQDRDVQRLSQQMTIRDLVVSGSISDEGLESISHLGNLERLSIKGGNFSGVGLATLSHLPKLRSLAISNATLTDDPVASIGRLTTLEDLSLSDTRLGSKQLRHLKNLKKLSTLDLSGNFVGDKDLPELQELTSLTELHLDRSMVTPNGIRKLREALPHLNVD